MAFKHYVKAIVIAVIFSLIVYLCAFHSSPVYAQPVRHTYCFPDADGSRVDFNVTLDTGILIEGGISFWSLTITASTNDFTMVKGIILRGVENGTKISRGVLLPVSNAFSSDVLFNITPLGIMPLYLSETLIIWQDVAGFPNSFSFDLVVTVEYVNGTMKDVHLKSDSAVLTFILPNPSKSPPEAINFMATCYLSAFLLPLTVAVINMLVKRSFRRVKVG